MMRSLRALFVCALAGALSLLAFAAQAQVAVRGASQASIAQTGIAFRSAGTFVLAASGNVTPGLPPGWQPNDLFLCVIETGDNVVLSMPAGWTLIATGTSGTAHRAALYRKVAGAVETAPTITHTGGNIIAARIAAFSGVDTTTPIETFSFYTDNGVDSTTESGAAAATITASLEDSMLVFTTHASDDYNSMGLPDTYPTAGGSAVVWTEAFFDATKTGNDASIGMHYGLAVTVGAQTAAWRSQRIPTGRNRVSHGAILALRPVANGLTIARPAGTVANDVMVASVSVAAQTITITPPAGWTLARLTTQPAGGATGMRLATYVKVATGAEPASYKWTFTGGQSGGAAGGIISFSGVDTTTPIDVEGGNLTASGLAHTATGISTIAGNAMLVGSHAFASSATWTPPGGMTEWVDIASLTSPNALGVALEMSTVVQPAAGATGDKTANASGNADAGLAHLVALRPFSFAHYAISGTTSGLTCEPSLVTITAHDAAHAAAVPPGGTLLDFSTTTGTGVWVSVAAGSGTLSLNGANNGVARYSWPGTESSVTLRLRHSTAATLGVNLTDGSRSEDATEDPNFSFTNTGFRVTADGTTTTTIGTHIAGKDSNAGFGAQTLFLQAVRTDTNTGSCTGVFASQTVTVELAGARINPTGGASQVSVRNSGGGMQAIATGAGAPAGYTAVSLAFDAGSKAPLVFNYPDSGSIQLYARYLLPSPPASTYMSGSSNTFVVRPFGLRISGVTSGATGPGDPVFAKAGANFNVTVTAVAWKAGDDADANGVPDTDAQIATNAATPNFGSEAAPASATVTHALNAPGGGNAGTLTGGAFSGFSSGARTQAMSWSEVGIINLFAQSANYLGGGQSVTNSAAGLTGVGRFYPDHFFLVAGSTLTNRQALACAPASGFSYLDEGFGLSFTLRARNTAGTVTQNYTSASGFAKLNPASFAAHAVGARSGALNLTSRIDSGSSSAGSWVAGVAAVTATTGIRRATPDNPDGPFTGTQVGIAPVDSDGVQLSAYDLDVDNNTVNDHAVVGSPTELRYGRLRLANAVGSESLALPVPVQAQYWNGIDFANNTLDSCTALPRAAIALDFNPPSNLTACETAVNAASVPIASGTGTITLSAPGAGNNGSVRLTVNLGSAGGSYCNPGSYVPAANGGLTYLLGRWDDASDPDSNANTAYDDKPSARATFGVFGLQRNSVIYQRENY